MEKRQLIGSSSEKEESFTPLQKKITVIFVIFLVLLNIVAYVSWKKEHEKRETKEKTEIIKKEG